VRSPTSCPIAFREGGDQLALGGRGDGVAELADLLALVAEHDELGVSAMPSPISCGSDIQNRQSSTAGESYSTTD
jgi:hypothetical protein